MDMEQIIGEIGVTVTTGPLADGWWGSYSWRKHQIVLRPRLGGIQHRSVLAHELGHAWYRHRGTSLRSERQASVWAAEKLINRQDFISAVRTSEHRAGIAHLLNVMPSDVDVYTSILTHEDKALLEFLAESDAC